MNFLTIYFIFFLGRERLLHAIISCDSETMSHCLSDESAMEYLEIFTKELDDVLLERSPENNFKPLGEYSIYCNLC